MASGQEHDKAIKIWFLPFGLLTSLFIGLHNGLIACIFFLIGGFWLSPDLDTRSNALKRWGYLKIIWRPYRKAIPHRSLFSHGPLIGTVLRLFYLCVVTAFIQFILQKLGLEITFFSIQLLKELANQYPQETFAMLLGLEVSAWLHLIQDGDPLPKEWHKLKKK